MEAVKPHPDTVKHRERVRELMLEVCETLARRAEEHDRSKTEPPEVAVFNAVTDKLHGLEYGTQAYTDALKELGPALKHHYEYNEHHVEHWPNGIDDMSLVDLVEMICDWKAAGERHDSGSIQRSLEVNAKRFKMAPQLANIFASTARERGWVE